MEMYKKPVMKIVELEKVDVLTCSKNGEYGEGFKCTDPTHISHTSCGSCHDGIVAP